MLPLLSGDAYRIAGLLVGIAGSIWCLNGITWAKAWFVKWPGGLVLGTAFSALIAIFSESVDFERFRQAKGNESSETESNQPSSLQDHRGDVTSTAAQNQPHPLGEWYLAGFQQGKEMLAASKMIGLTMEPAKADLDNALKNLQVKTEEIEPAAFDLCYEGFADGLRGSPARHVLPAGQESSTLPAPLRLAFRATEQPLATGETKPAERSPGTESSRKERPVTSTIGSSSPQSKSPNLGGWSYERAINLLLDHDPSAESYILPFYEGIYTHVGKGFPAGGSYVWIRVEISAGSSEVSLQYGYPVESDWRKGEPQKVEIFCPKSSDTGQRQLTIDVNSMDTLFLNSDGTVTYYRASNAATARLTGNPVRPEMYIPLEKKDSFPFSR